jgi:hypothetical protein
LTINLLRKETTHLTFSIDVKGLEIDTKQPAVLVGIAV